MNKTLTQSKSLRVLAAAALVLLLAGVLGVRLAAWARASTPPAAAASAVPAPATVPEARPIAIAALQLPCWTCPGSKEWPLRFRTDLDLLAPLGTGTSNAAAWFKDFAKPNGPRLAEAEAAMARRVQGPGELGEVLPGTDPLLLEAEPWCDQATMRFYPNFFPIKGYATQIPNLMLQLTFARSWVARGMAASDPAKAMEDFRRAIRLGRLLRQEDTTVIQDLVGLSCIRDAALAVYELAVKDGNAQLALVAGIVVGEVAPQQLIGGQRLTKTDLLPDVKRGAGGATLELAEAKLADIVSAATGSPDRRFRAETTLELNLVRFLGTPSQREKASSVLDQLAAGSDPVVAAMAVWSRDTNPAGYLDGPLTLLPPPAPKSKRP